MRMGFIAKMVRALYFGSLLEMVSVKLAVLQVKSI
jgi:hypothetical protein